MTRSPLLIFIIGIAGLWAISCKGKKENNADPQTKQIQGKGGEKKPVKPVVPGKTATKTPNVKAAVSPLAVVKPVGLTSGTLSLQSTIPVVKGNLFKAVQAMSNRLYGMRARKPFGSVLLDMATGKELVRFKGVPRPIAISPDGKTLAVILGAHVELYRFATMEKLGELEVLMAKKPAKDAPPMGTTLFVSVDFSKDGKYLATGEINFGKFDSNHKQTLSVWNIHDRKRLATYGEEETDANVCDVRFLPGNKELVMVIVGGPGKTGSFSRRMIMEAGNMVMPGLALKAQKAIPFNIPCDECIDSWSVVGPYYAVSYSMKLDGSVNLYRLADGSPAGVLPFKKKAEDDSVRRFALSADGSMLAFGVCAEKKGPPDDFGNPTMDQIPYRFIMVDAKSFKETATLEASALDFHPVSGHLAYVKGDDLIVAAVSAPDKPLGTMKIEGNPMALGFSADGTHLILATDKGTFIYQAK
ncbi:WD40 repeat domain-containing protein [Myxococcota bacterium]|nr:WD40 repeat domain-containing protein [Myxococcota bacterium]